MFSINKVGLTNKNTKGKLCKSVTFSLFVVAVLVYGAPPRVLECMPLLLNTYSQPCFYLTGGEGNQWRDV